jgi:hypothetical protein
MAPVDRRRAAGLAGIPGLNIGGNEEGITRDYPEQASGLAGDYLFPGRMGPVAAKADAGRLYLEEFV